MIERPRPITGAGEPHTDDAAVHHIARRRQSSSDFAVIGPAGAELHHYAETLSRLPLVSRVCAAVVAAADTCCGRMLSDV